MEWCALAVPQNSVRDNSGQGRRTTGSAQHRAAHPGRWAAKPRSPPRPVQRRTQISQSHTRGSRLRGRLTARLTRLLLWQHSPTTPASPRPLRSRPAQYISFYIGSNFTSVIRERLKRLPSPGLGPADQPLPLPRLPSPARRSPEDPGASHRLLGPLNVPRDPRCTSASASWPCWHCWQALSPRSLWSSPPRPSSFTSEPQSPAAADHTHAHIQPPPAAVRGPPSRAAPACLTRRGANRRICAPAARRRCPPAHQQPTPPPLP